VEKRPLMTHPGVGPLTALAYGLVIGTPERFHWGKADRQLLGLVREEKSREIVARRDTSALPPCPSAKRKENFVRADLAPEISAMMCVRHYSAGYGTGFHITRMRLGWIV